MKKILTLVLIVILTVPAFSACGTQTETTPPDSSDRAIDYLGIKSDAVYIYDGEGSNEDADKMTSQLMFYDYVKEDQNVYQRRTLADNETMLEVIKYKNGAVYSELADATVYYFDDATSWKTYSTTCVLKEPLTLGQKWDRGIGYTGEVDNDNNPITFDIVSEITGVGVEVTTLMGTFNALEVSSIGNGSEYNLKEYYVKGLGLIKIEQQNGDTTFSLFMSKINENTPYEIVRRFFYPGEEVGVQKYELRKLTFHTNEDSYALLANAFRNYTEYSGKSIISADTKINSVSYLREERVKIDFSSGFIPPAGTDIVTEQAMLRSVVNTIGHFYRVSKVCITVGGQGYVSENFNLAADQYMSIGTSEELGITTEAEAEFTKMDYELNCK